MKNDDDIKAMTQAELCQIVLEIRKTVRYAEDATDCILEVADLVGIDEDDLKSH